MKMNVKKTIGVAALGCMMLAAAACGGKKPQNEFVWEGTESVRVVRGDSVDLLDGVTVKDASGNDLSDKITITNDDGFSTHLADGYTVTYAVTAEDGTVSETTKDFVVEVGHNVANGDFSLNEYNWSLDVPGGKAEMAIKDGAAEVTVTDPGTAWWSIQLYQAGAQLQANTTYRLSLEASSPEGRTIAAGYEDIPNGYSMLNPGFQVMELSSETKTYEVYFTTSADCANTKVVIYLGNMDADKDQKELATVKIDNVNIEKVETCPDVTFEGVEDLTLVVGQEFDPAAGVSSNGAYEINGYVPASVAAAGEYYLTYICKQESGQVSFVNRKISIKLPKDFEYQAVNGSFDYGYMGWTKDVNQTAGKGNADFTDNGDGTVSIKVNNPSDAGWHIQLYQTATTIREGETYVIKFRAKADTARFVALEVCNPANGFADVTGLAQTGVLNFELGTEFKDYEFAFTATETLDNIKLSALLGNVDGLVPAGSTVTVDEFNLYKYDPFNEELTNAGDGSCSYWVYDNISGSYEEDTLVVDFANGAGADPWNNQLYQNRGLVLEAGHTYEVKVRLMSDIDRVIRAWIEDVAKGYAPIATDDRTVLELKAGEWAELVYTVEVTEETATHDAKFVVMFGDATAAGAHKVSLDYFQVTDITLQ